MLTFFTRTKYFINQIPEWWLRVGISNINNFDHRVNHFLFVCFVVGEIEIEILFRHGRSARDHYARVNHILYEFF